MHVDISCQKCGRRKRMDIGIPKVGLQAEQTCKPGKADQIGKISKAALEEYLHLLRERLSHQPSFECFGGHFEFAPPLSGFWEIHWDTLADE